MAIKKLPTYHGFTVDFRLRQFRKVIANRTIEFIDFNSSKGKNLLYGLFVHGYSEHSMSLGIDNLWQETNIEK